MTTTLQDADLDLTDWIAEIDEQSALDAALAKVAIQVAGELTETTVEWGEDTICAVCVHPLPAGATAYADNDGVLCNSCAEVELEAAGRTAR